MLARDIAHHPFEQEYRVRKRERIAMDEIHLELGGPHFVDHRIDIEPHQLTIVIDMVDDRFIFVHRLQPVRLARGFGATA